MRNKKINKEILNEELKRFKSLTNYDYYVDDKLNEGFPIFGLEEDRPVTPEDDNIILGSIYEDEDENEFADEIDDITADLGGETEEDEEELEIPEEPIDTEEPEDEVDIDIEEPSDFTEPEDDSNEIELDVTELVRGSEAAKESADAANSKISELMGMFGKLKQQLSSMDKISSKIDNLEKEIERRNPTPVEKLEMRSLDSFPYNVKLTDFWDEKSDNYDVEEKQEPKTYTLTKDDVDSDYNSLDIKKSFDIE